MLKIDVIEIRPGQMSFYSGSSPVYARPTLVFSGGEVHPKLAITRIWLFKSEYEDNLTIYCYDYSMNGFMALCEMNEILRRLGTNKIDVIYPYLPYARQDRVIEENESFSLKVFCQLLNSQKFDSVTVYDPHSDVGPALIDRCIVVPQHEIVPDVVLGDFLYDPNTMIICPDAGAFKKISKLIKDDMRICIGTKQRDAQGKIIRTSIFQPATIIGKRCLIIDDICDGGRTFIELAKTLLGGKEKEATEIYLYVTHGIFSKGFDELEKYFTNIYTTNSFEHVRLPDFVKVVPVL